METTNRKISELLDFFENIDFVIGGGKDDVEMFPNYFLTLEPIYFEKRQKLEKWLTAVYLSGNIDVLHKVKAELIGIKAKLNSFPLIKLAEISSKFEAEEINEIVKAIESDKNKEIIELKLTHINSIIDNVDRYLTNLTGGANKVYVAQTVTLEDKIKEKLETLGVAFDNSAHIDIIIVGFVNYLSESRYPETPHRAVLRKMKLTEFLKPFRTMFDEGILQRDEISRLLTYFIEKPFISDAEYSQGYLNRKLSEIIPKT